MKGGFERVVYEVGKVKRRNLSCNFDFFNFGDVGIIEFLFRRVVSMECKEYR